MKVAIDGPAGSGKSTIAKLVSQRLGFKHIDTGAYYRWVTYQALIQGVSWDEPKQLVSLAQSLDFRNIDETKIRSLEVTKHVSTVSAISGVRTEVVAQQRAAAEKQDVVMEGRDIGSVVFPQAEVKIYLTASVQERAQRRYKELQEKRVQTTLAEIEAEIIRRDGVDSGRKASPLLKTPDAVEVDSTGLTIEVVVEKIINIVKLKGAEK